MTERTKGKCACGRLGFLTDGVCLECQKRGAPAEPKNDDTTQDNTDTKGPGILGKLFGKGKGGGADGEEKTTQKEATKKK